MPYIFFSLVLTLHAILSKFTFQGLSRGVNMVRRSSLEREAVHVSGAAEDLCQTTEFLSLSFIKVFEISVSAWYWDVWIVIQNCSSPHAYLQNNT